MSIQPAMPLSIESGTPVCDVLDGPTWLVDRGDDGHVVVRSSLTGEPSPADWRDRLAFFLRTIPGVKLVGAKRMMVDGHVFSMGEMVIHPKGFHHRGKGVNGNCYRFPEEVDTIAGGLMLVEGKAFDEVGGEALLETFGELGPLTLGLALRQKNYRILGIPQVVITDEFSPRNANDENAAAPDATRLAALFREKFNFNWTAPDLDVVRQEHAADVSGGGLLWNAFHHAGMMPFEKYEQRGALCWQGYKDSEPFRQRAHAMAQIVGRFANEFENASVPILDVGSGDGLFSHLIARHGCKVIGIDPEPEGVAQSQTLCDSHDYPNNDAWEFAGFTGENVSSLGGGPQFRGGRGDAIPLDDASVSCVSLFDVIEHLNNPVGVLREISRVLKPGGHFICITPAWQFGANSDPTYHGYEFTQQELNRLINTTDDLTIVHNGNIGGIYRDLIAVAKKSQETKFPA